MTKTYREVRAELAGTHGAPAEDTMPCHVCHQQTPRSVLSSFGARCGVCYGTYLRSGQPAAVGRPLAASKPGVVTALDAFRRVAPRGGGVE